METMDSLRKFLDEEMNKKEAQRKLDLDMVEVTTAPNTHQIVLPEGMTKEHAIEWLQKRMREDETFTEIYEEIDALPLDAAYALMKVIEKIYGWSRATSTPGFWGDQPPTFVNLEIGFGENVQVLWGSFEIPGIEGRLQTGSKINRDGMPSFVLGGEIKQKYKKAVAEIAKRTREYLLHNSVYHRSAIKIKTKDNGNLAEKPPTFLDISAVNPENLIFSDDVMEQVNTHIFTPIRKTANCRENNINLKRTILLEGPFGTGKTLTAQAASRIATENGWTFIYLDRVGGLKGALLLAKKYQPAVIFAEDIDRVVPHGRSVAVDDILNTIDGVDTKNDEIITILTTNEVEKIERAMMRPGRLDAVIHIGPPDRKAAEKLVRSYSGDLLHESVDLSEVGLELEGQIPATIAEIVKRSKLYSISRTPNGEKVVMNAADLVNSARGMKNHLALLNAPCKDESSPNEKLGEAMGNVMAEVMSNGKTKMGVNVEKILRAVE